MYFFSGDVLPQFVGDLTNLTAAIGREAVFSCNIKNLRNYKVSQLFPNFDVHTLGCKILWTIATLWDERGVGGAEGVPKYL